MAMISDRKALSYPSIWTLPALAIGLAAKAFSEWHARARQRHQLAWLSDHELKDIGKGQADAVVEGNQQFWRARIDLPTGV